MTFIKSIIENSFFQNFVSGITGGLIIYFIQKKSDKKNREIEKLRNATVGKKDLKILDKDFLYNYEPGNITIDKIIDDFGKPIRISKYQEYKSNIFEFKNAKVDIVEAIADNSILSITVYSKLDDEFPINCRLSYEEEDAILGKAKISEVIIRDSMFFKSYDTQLGYETIIGTFNSYRQTKHLNYFYQIDGKFTTIEDSKDAVIKQVCVTQLEACHPFFSFRDTFYE